MRGVAAWEAMLLASGDEVVTTSDDDQAETDSEDKSPDSSHKKAKYTHYDKGTQHSDAVIEGDQEDDKADNNQAVVEIEEGESLSGVALKDLYSWLETLPQWLQEQILDSSVVQALIESAARTANLYDIRSVSQDFVKNMLLPDNIKISIEDSRDAKAVMAEVTHDLVDVSMVYTGLAAAVLVLPTVNSMLGDGAFGGFDGIAVF